ncbi:RNA recognition motif domain-containing protein [Hirsutella rhossiliensis]|uniref:RNA recognition motif domain-containing protein n=1 Tax=Hirsutella rhossiliensis TaxID=111463 RepID=A0A9P8MV25_9HYPO|nr:RNA recognition motif domain-containing protein [Hirsutella rhossiliensis]KAH0961937.1 RNA recognition motif domain-containing protein [Hirsutella rhossiliensis]
MATKAESSAPADVADTTTSAKRKSTSQQEIEVDLSAPEPPSKRARRALKKGKALPTKPASDAEKDDSDAEKKDKARSEHAIWVGNLPFTATAALLRRWLVDNSGQVITEDSITRIKLPTVKEPGRDKTKAPANKGFAFVDFADIGPKVAAVALSESDFQGRRLLIKDAKSFEGRPKREKEPAADVAAEHAGAGANKDANASRKIFVGNMSFKTTDEDLARNFEKCGEIEWVKVATFEDTGKCKGFGWVKFKEPESAAWAVKGFVKIKEDIETEDDFKSDGDNDDVDSDGGSDSEDKQRQKQVKTRKWWVNRLLGRQLKLELAEDDQTRYKKRFGKDAPKRDGVPRASSSRDGKHRTAGEQPDKGPAPVKEASDIRVAKLTGALVKHTGTKMTFD